jgi:hypothetical protein
MHEKVSSLACLAAFLIRDCQDEKINLLEPMLLNIFFKSVRSADRAGRTFGDLILIWSLWGEKDISKRFFDKNFRLLYLGKCLVMCRLI